MREYKRGQEREASADLAYQLLDVAMGGCNDPLVVALALVGAARAVDIMMTTLPPDERERYEQLKALVTKDIDESAALEGMHGAN